MMFRYFWILVVILLAACASPQKKFDKQDYEGAYKSALRSIEGGKKKTQDKVILEKALAEIITKEWEILENLRSSGEADKLEKSLQRSEKLQKKIIAAKPYLRSIFDQDLQNIQDADNATRKELYYAFLSFGEEDLEKSMTSGDKRLAQDAYSFFQKAKEYDRGEVPLDSLMNVCYQYGTMIYNVNADATFAISMAWEIDRTFDDVTNVGHSFLEVYYDKNISGIDCDIKVDFRNLDFDDDEEVTTQSFSKEVEDGYRTEKDTSGNEIQIQLYKTIEGSVRIITKRRVGEWEARVSIDSRTKNCDLSDYSFFAEIESTVEHYELSGDENAIPDEYKVSFPDELMDEDDMAEEMLEEIYGEFISYYF